MGPIRRIKPCENYRLFIELAEGHEIVLDFSGKLHTIRFHKLINQDVFRKAVTDGYSVIWKNGKIMVSFGEIMDILQNYRFNMRCV